MTFLLVLLAVFSSPLLGETSNRVLVYAAASMADVFVDVGERYQSMFGQPVVFSFAGSSTLARQIDQGANADVYVSANKVWVDYLQKRGHLREKGPVTFASSSLVAVSPAELSIKIEPNTDFDISSAFSGRLAIGDPRHVPAGQYAEQALVSLGWWDQIFDRLVVANDVRAALTYVERGACDLGVVYATDAKISTRVKVVATFPDSLHLPIRYFAAALAASENKGAQRFVEFLSSAGVQKILVESGFRTEVEEPR